MRTIALTIAACAFFAAAGTYLSATRTAAAPSEGNAIKTGEFVVQSGSVRFPFEARFGGRR
jgi:hypothetical protein